MKLEDQVCSLKLAKRLKELGVKQESQFYWINPPNAFPWYLRWIKTNGRPSQTMLDDGRAVSAFTVAELGEMLPDIETYKVSNAWNIKNPMEGNPGVSGYVEADARAKMLIYLLEKGLMKP